jgi:uncharacterized protein (DUF3084 family)
MRADDFPILAYLVNVASGGACQLDTARLRTATLDLLDGTGEVRDTARREDFVRMLEAQITRTGPQQESRPAQEAGPMQIEVTFKSKKLNRRLRRIEEMLRQVLTQQQQLMEQGDAVMENLTHLEQSVHTTSGVVESAYTLIQGIAQQMRDNAGNQEAIEALADELDQKAAKLAQAVSEFPANPAGSTGTTGSGSGTTEPAPEPEPAAPAEPAAEG